MFKMEIFVSVLHNFLRVTNMFFNEHVTEIATFPCQRNRIL